MEDQSNYWFLIQFVEMEWWKVMKNVTTDPPIVIMLLMLAAEIVSEHGAEMVSEMTESNAIQRPIVPHLVHFLV